MVTAGYAWIPTQPNLNEGIDGDLVTENRTWQQFIKAKENKHLTLAEQKRKYADERKRLAQHQAFINSGLFLISAS